jgi:hypothetical protein
MYGNQDLEELIKAKGDKHSAQPPRNTMGALQERGNKLRALRKELNKG